MSPSVGKQWSEVDGEVIHPLYPQIPLDSVKAPGVGRLGDERWKATSARRQKEKGGFVINPFSG